MFVNYRLMSRKIAQAYEGQESDSVPRLWRRGVRLAVAESSWRAVLANGAWLTLLAMAPRRLAAAMVVLRFNRAEFFRIAKEKINRALGAFRPAPARVLP